MSEPDFLGDLHPDDRELGRRLAALGGGNEAARKTLRARLLARGPRRASPLARPAALAALLIAAIILLPPRSARLRSGADAPRFARGEHGLPILPGRFDADPGAAPRFEETGSRRRLLWDLDGERFVLESRRITIDDIFVRR